MIKTVGLIGLGAIGVPLAFKLEQHFKNNFFLIADNKHKKQIQKSDIYINGSLFSPIILTDISNEIPLLDIVFVCTKNYSLETVVTVLKPLISDNTVIFPLQNGVYSYSFFSNYFPNNRILEGFVQGPNTKIIDNNYVFQNPGILHVGSSKASLNSFANELSILMNKIGIDCVYDKDIKKTVWKKLMLNVSGNALTALTEMDYTAFKKSSDARKICIDVMHEFQKIAIKEEVFLSEEDINDVLNYFINYKESKHTSMLEDVLKKRRTENEYIAGFAYNLAKKYGVSCPNIKILYQLMKIKELNYLGKLS